MKNRLLFIRMLVLLALSSISYFSFAQSTSWKGTSSTSWNTASNWTNGVPTATVDAIIGDANFTGSNQPTTGSNSTCNNLIIGGSIASTLTVNSDLTVSGDVILNNNGTLIHNTVTLTVKGDWINNGTYTTKTLGSKNSETTFAGTSQSITGSTAPDFKKLTINTGSTTYLSTDISVSKSFTVNGTFIPVENPIPYVVSGAGTMTIGSMGVVNVNAPSFGENYSLTGSKTLTAGSTIDYSATLIDQTVSNSFTYSTLRISGGRVKTLAGNLTALVSSNAAYGNIYVTSGTLALGAFTANRGTSTTGGTINVSNGATLKIGSTNTWPANYATSTLDLNSTVEYSGTNQSVSARSYGNLTFSSSSGAAVKTLPASAFTIAGNFTSTIGTGTSVSYTAAAAMTINGFVNIGSSTTFNAGSFTHTVTGNWVNDGTLTGSTSTFTLNGSGSNISGTGIYNFNNLTITGSGYLAASNTNLSVSGNLATSGSGSFTHTSGGTLTMSGTSKTISGTGFAFSNLTCSGTISTSSSFTITDNLSVGGSLSASAGTITLSGAAKTISGTGTISFAGLSVTGAISTTSSFSIGASLDVSGSFTATSASTATFTGTSTLNGTANLYNVTLNGTSLTLSTNAVLGIANAYTITAGALNVTSYTPNTVNFNGTGAQNIASSSYHHLTISNGNTKTASGAVTVNGDFTIGSSTTFSAGSYTHNLYGSWINSGSFTAGASTINFTGSANVTLTGAATFNVLTVNKTASTNTVTLVNNISVPTINMTNGTLNTGANTLTITNTRTGNGIILGTITRTHTFSTGVAYAFEGPNNTITFTATSGVTSVTVKVTVGSVADFPFGGSINRLYDITVPAGTYTATLRLHYEDAELNGNTESSMQTWRYSGSAWAAAGKSANNTTSNYVEQSGLTNIATRWTCSDDANLVRWNGSVSTDWFNASNWTVVQGSPSRPPSANDIVEIGTVSFTNQPSINSSAVAKSITFGSIKAVTLTVTTGGSLTTQGNISGTWAANATHTINVNNQTLTVNGDMTLSNGTANQEINVNLDAGTLAITGSLTQTGGANVVFSGAGNLNIGTNYSYSSGTFTAGTGTVQYNGTVSQTVAGVTYNNLTINKASGNAALNAAATVSGNLAITAGQFDLNANLTVSGNATISSGATLNNNGGSTTVGGNWSNSGNYISSNGSITFNGTGAQSISATTFNNFTVNKASGTATLTGNIIINGNFTVTAGTLDMATYTGNRSSVGGTMTLGSSAALLAGGANNFPSNFATYSINSSSTTTYNGTMAQTVLGTTYGHLVFSNGGSNAKTLSAAAVVNGNLTINSGATFSAGAYSLDLYGNWVNNGTFTASTSNVQLRGSSKTITGNTTFYQTTVYGSYTVAGSNLTFSNTLNMLSGSSFITGNGTTTISGNLTVSGTLSSTGTTTFTGTVLQSLQFNSATNLNVINFNGSVAPSLTSTSSPTFSTVTINNTAGITANAGWMVATAFTVSAGASFTGGNITHTFNGSFTNNGTVSSSGTLDFEPSTAQTIQLKGTNFTSTGRVIFGGSGAITVTGTPNTLTNITIANSAGVSPSVGWTIGNDFIINNNAVFNAGGYSYTVAGDIFSNGTLNGGTSTFTMTSASGKISGSATTTFYDFVVSGVITANADFNIDHNFTNNNSIDATVGTPTFTGSVSGTIGGTAATYTLAQFTIAKIPGSTVTLAKNVVGVTELDILSGVLDASTFSITKDAAGGNLVVLNNATLKIGGTNTLPSFTTYSLDTLSTVEYTGSTQAISAATPYGNLTISAAGTKTASAVLTILNNFSLSSGTFVSGSYVDTLIGNWNMTGGTFTNTGSTIYLKGTGNQIITSTGAFNNLTINKASGATTLGTDITINGILNFTKGILTTGSYKVILPSGGSVSGAGQSTGWVYGNLQKNVATGSNVSRTFEVGGSTNYNNAVVLFPSVSVAGNLIVSMTATDHPNLSTSGINVSKSVNRYWTVTNSGITFTTASITFNWAASDLDGGVNTANFAVAKYAGANWTSQTIASPNATSIQATGITSFGDFAIGEGGVIIWTGTLSTSWTTPGNWQTGVLPSGASIVTIPGSLANYPVISSGTASAGNLTIQGGASLTVTGAVLQIAGTITNSGTFTVNNGGIEMNGSSAQTIPAGVFAGNSIKDLTINNNAGVTLGGPLSLTSLLTISNGSLTTGGYLTLKSTATSNASVARITSNAATPISGNVTVERYVQGRRKYRLITSSVTTSAAATLAPGQESLSIWGNWQNSGDNSASNVGTFITGGTSADGYDQQTSNASLFTYDAANRRFTGFTSANGKNTKYTPLKAGQAYYMFVFGDRKNTIFTSTPNNTVLKTTGTLLAGDQTFNTSSTTPISNVNGRYTLIGNPFASAIDWASLPKTDIANTYWGWDPNLNSTGGYVTVSTTGTTTLIAPYSGNTGLNQYIQAGQGFFVQTTGPAPVLSIREQDKVGTFNANTFRTTSDFSANGAQNNNTNNIPLLAINLLYEESGAKVLADGALAAFDTGFTKGVGKEDASKIVNTGEGLAITNGTELLSIDARPMPQNGDTLLLNASKLTKSKYTLQIFAQQLEGSKVQPYLEDAYLKTVQPLLLNDTNNIVINIVASDAASSDASRFRIVFHSSVGAPENFTLSASKKEDRNVQVAWTVTSETGIQQYEIERSSDNRQFAKIAAVVAKGMGIKQQYQWIDTTAIQGTNYYRIHIILLDGTSGYSQTAVVNVDAIRSALNVFPNPVQNQQFNLQLKNIEAGQYLVQLFNCQGLKVLSQAIDHQGIAGPSQTIFLKNKLPGGMYILQVANKQVTYHQTIFLEQ